jgi:metal-dependent amidase/aminoacylase/carboxypeptidase family protein
MYPEVYNDNMLFDMLVDAAGGENVEVLKPLMIAEDFSYYRRVAPELMFFLGSRNR